MWFWNELINNMTDDKRNHWEALMNKNGRWRHKTNFIMYVVIISALNPKTFFKSLKTYNN